MEYIWKNHNLYQGCKKSKSQVVARLKKKMNEQMGHEKTRQVKKESF